MIQKEIDDGVFSVIRLQEGRPQMTFYLSYRNQNNLSVVTKELIATFKKSLP
jgi:hypothetical protein